MISVQRMKAEAQTICFITALSAHLLFVMNSLYSWVKSARITGKEGERGNIPLVRESRHMKVLRRNFQPLDL